LSYILRSKQWSLLLKTFLHPRKPFWLLVGINFMTKSNLAH
jgi:hypothetical protein